MSKDNRTADELQEARSEIKKQYFKLHRVSEDLLFSMVQAPGCKCWDQIDLKFQGESKKHETELNFKGFLNSMFDAWLAHKKAIRNLDKKIKLKMEEEE